MAKNKTRYTFLKTLFIRIYLTSVENKPPSNPNLIPVYSLIKQINTVTKSHKVQHQVQHQVSQSKSYCKNT